MNQPNDRERRFAGWLVRLDRDENRATLAALRRGLGMEPGTTAWMLRYLPAEVTTDLTQHHEDTFCLVAALFALHPLPWPEKRSEGQRTNLGASLAWMVAEERQRTGDIPASVENRFEAVLSCHLEDLPEHLRRIIGLLKSREIPVDWAQLLHDIRGWDWESRSVQGDWARAFWRVGQAAS